MSPENEQPEPADEAVEVAIEANVFDGQLWLRADSVAAKLLSMATVYEDAGWEILTYGGITPASVCREMGTQFEALAEAVRNR